MIIRLSLNPFLYELFPTECDSIEQLKSNLKTFTGYQALAYYYTSWALAMPDQLAQLQMPFEKEFEIAKKISQL